VHGTQKLGEAALTQCILRVVERRRGLEQLGRLARGHHPHRSCSHLLSAKRPALGHRHVRETPAHTIYLAMLTGPRAIPIPGAISSFSYPLCLAWRVLCEGNMPPQNLPGRFRNRHICMTHVWSGLLVTLQMHVLPGDPSFSQIGPMRTITPYRLPIKHRSAILCGGRVSSSSKVEHSHRHGQYLNRTLFSGVRKGILLMSAASIICLYTRPFDPPEIPEQMPRG
jgi:hypothetical protein